MAMYTVCSQAMKTNGSLIFCCAGIISWILRVLCIDSWRLKGRQAFSSHCDFGVLNNNVFGIADKPQPIQTTFRPTNKQQLYDREPH